MTSDFYPKKFGLIKRKITHEAPSKAIPITTFIIIFLPPHGSPVAILIPPMIIKTKEVIKISVTNILVKLHIRTGKAVFQVTPVSSGLLALALDSIHLPINGILVLSNIQQQTHGASQGIQVSPTSLFQVPQSHLQKSVRVHDIQVVFDGGVTGGVTGGTTGGTTGAALQIQHLVPPPQSFEPTHVC